MKKNIAIFIFYIVFAPVILIGIVVTGFIMLMSDLFKSDEDEDEEDWENIEE